MTIFSTPRALLGPRRRVAGALLAAFVFATSLTFTARPAEAAGSVSACFRVKTNGQYFQTTYVQPGLTTFLMYSTDAVNWYPYTVTALDQTGCAAWTISGNLRNYYLRVWVYSNRGQGIVGATYQGWSPLYALPGDRHADLGFAYLSCDLCWN